MAITYGFCETRTSSYSSSATLAKGGKPTTVITTVNQTFRCIVRGTTAAVSDAQVACQDALPKVGFSNFYSAATGQVLYNAICVSKNVTRNKSNKYVFDITCTFKTQPLDAEVCLGNPVTELVDIGPTVQASISGRDRVLYTDYDDKACSRFDGTKMMFNIPVVGQDPVLTLTISQFEAGISYNTMMNRSYIVNDSLYGGTGAGTWRCVMTSAVEQEVQLAAGPITAVKATYQVQQNLSFYKGLTTGTKITTGWEQLVPLVSTHFCTRNGNGDVAGIFSFADVTSGEKVTDYIHHDGERRAYAEGGADDRPDYLSFENYPKASFSFLQA